VLVGLWALLFVASGSLTRGPSPKNLGGDFALFLSGARVMGSGGNPYDQHVLYQNERQMLRRDGVRPPAFDPFMRVGNPPLLFWALQPLTKVSFGPIAIAWSATMYALCALAFLGCLSFLGWRRRWFPLVLYLAMPQTIYAAYYGNVDGLVVVGLGCSVAIVRRSPFAAGALLSLALLKPQVALAGAGLIMLFLSTARLRSIAGFFSATVLAFLLMLITTGSASIGWWLGALTRYSQRLGDQPDIASLSGLYVYSAADAVRVALGAASLLVAVAATVIWWWKRRAEGGGQPLDIAWLWIVWFLATPFAHFHDEVLLTLPVLAIAGTDGKWIGRWPGTVALYVLLLSILIFPTSRAHTDFQSITLIVVLACAVVQYTRYRHHTKDEAPPALAAEPGWASG
jgi:hypothetical protein